MSETRDESGDAATWRVEDLIPHRDPFCFITEIIDLEPGKSARGRWRLTGEEAFFAGHFPGRATLPGVLMVESLAQLGAAAVLADPHYASLLPLFGGVDRARFQRQVVPGEILDLDVQLTRLSGRAGTGQGAASVNGERACEAGLMFVFVPR